MVILQAAIGIVVWSGILFPPALAIYALFKWRGGWRFAAALPVVVAAAFFAPLIPDWLHDPSAHGLWGLLFLPLAMLLAVYSGVVLIFWRRKHKPAASASTQR